MRYVPYIIVCLVMFAVMPSLGITGAAFTIVCAALAASCFSGQYMEYRRLNPKKKEENDTAR